MAHINISDFTAIGLDMNRHTATSYRVAKDKDFTKIIDQSLHDTHNLLKWTTPLPKLEEDGEGFYSDLTELYASVKLHFGKYETPWWDLQPRNQNIQDVVVTQDGKLPRYESSESLGWPNTDKFGSKDQEYYKYEEGDDVDDNKPDRDKYLDKYKDKDKQDGTQNGIEVEEPKYKHDSYVGELTGEHDGVTPDPLNRLHFDPEPSYRGIEYVWRFEKEPKE